MAQVKKVSISAMDKIIKDTYEPIESVEWNGQTVTIKRALSFHEMLKFVDSVTKSCFVLDTGEFIPEIKDFALRSNIVGMYSNVALPDPLDHQYQILYQSGIVELIKQHIDREQLNEMEIAIGKKVSHLADANIQLLWRKIDDAVSAVSGVVESVNGIFAGLDSGDIKKFVDAVNESGFVDEEKIVHMITGKKEDSEQP